ncbi:uncharacterized protein SPAPADRAFT_50656 [Spathaspora passalidarum NRRL Y-27907]|uniref:Uncharacterized protein n=1 Tax=Spathaspora passalidarum (strain NRRL Y-27907 / 11-Y1) TaxID=619300 RepID=G3AP28_SPAPN|nr:uncharacterized protein SPAPADRAFT_50656 [Spathaspora passalidarum NRRL Y-27907]EGW32059.1 hypothetical protein SPAPADRAFT_50656 [Spathaspora passalidarum NRRL Y-27907]
MSLDATNRFGEFQNKIQQEIIQKWKTFNKSVKLEVMKQLQTQENQLDEMIQSIKDTGNEELGNLFEKLTTVKNNMQEAGKLQKSSLADIITILDKIQKEALDFDKFRKDHTVFVTDLNSLNIKLQNTIDKLRESQDKNRSKLKTPEKLEQSSVVSQNSKIMELENEKCIFQLKNSNQVLDIDKLLIPTSLDVVSSKTAMHISADDGRLEQKEKTSFCQTTSGKEVDDVYSFDNIIDFPPSKKYKRE